MNGPIRMLGFARRGGRFHPTNNHAAAFQAPVDVLTGEIVEPAPGGSWQVAKHPPDYDPAAVLLWLRRDAERAQERAAAKAERRERERLGIFRNRELADALAADDDQPEQETP